MRKKEYFRGYRGGDLQADDTLLLLICGKWTTYYITLKGTPVFDSNSIISKMYHVGKEEESIASEVKDHSMMSHRKYLVF